MEMEILSFGAEEARPTRRIVDHHTYIIYFNQYNGQPLTHVVSHL
jgi:hypothetical protein